MPKIIKSPLIKAQVNENSGIITRMDLQVYREVGLVILDFLRCFFSVLRTPFGEKKVRRSFFQNRKSLPLSAINNWVIDSSFSGTHKAQISCETYFVFGSRRE